MLVGGLRCDLSAGYFGHSAFGGRRPRRWPRRPVFSLILGYGATIFPAAIRSSSAIGNETYSRSGLTAVSAASRVRRSSGTFRRPECGSGWAEITIPAPWSGVAPWLGLGVRPPGRWPTLAVWALTALISVVSVPDGQSGLRLPGAVGEQPVARRGGARPRHRRRPLPDRNGCSSQGRLQVLRVAGSLSLGAVQRLCRRHERGAAAMDRRRRGHAWVANNPLYAAGGLCAVRLRRRPIGVNLQSHGLPNQLTDIASLCRNSACARHQSSPPNSRTRSDQRPIVGDGQIERVRVEGSDRMKSTAGWRSLLDATTAATSRATSGAPHGGRQEWRGLPSFLIAARKVRQKSASGLWSMKRRVLRPGANSERRFRPGAGSWPPCCIWA